jgi:hypothetical protein
LTVDIAIAGILFRLSSEDVALQILPNGGLYEPFVVDAGSSVDPADRIDVALRMGEIPSEERYAKIFETPDSWTLLRDGDRYQWLDVLASSGNVPDSVVCFSRPLTSVTVHCGKMCLTEASGTKMLLNPITYPLDQILLMYALAERGGACLHAAAVDVAGRGYLFPGKSGAGKTTISRCFASRGRSLLSDDRVVVRKTGEAFRCHGTPWAGDARIAENRNLPLHGIFFIVHGDENRVQRLTPAAAFEKLMPVTSIPWYDDRVMPEILSFCEGLVGSVPAYNLHFRPDGDVVAFFEQQLSESGLSG